jgi:hypothetical protein
MDKPLVGGAIGSASRDTPTGLPIQLSLDTVCNPRTIVAKPAVVCSKRYYVCLWRHTTIVIIVLCRTKSSEIPINCTRFLRISAYTITSASTLRFRLLNMTNFRKTSPIFRSLAAVDCSPASHRNGVSLVLINATGGLSSRLELGLIQCLGVLELARRSQ